MRWFFLFVCSYLLVACTPMEWRRGGEVASMDSDVYRKCQFYASVEGMRRMPLFGGYPTPTYVGRDASGRPVFVNPTWTRSDQLMVEHNAMMHCMLGQGFDLVPINPPSQPTVGPEKPALDPARKGP